MNIICSNSLSVKHKRIKMPYFLLFHCYNDKKKIIYFLGKNFIHLLFYMKEGHLMFHFQDIFRRYEVRKY